MQHPVPFRLLVDVTALQPVSGQSGYKAWGSLYMTADPASLSTQVGDQFNNACSIWLSVLLLTITMPQAVPGQLATRPGAPCTGQQTMHDFNLLAMHAASGHQSYC